MNIIKSFFILIIIISINACTDESFESINPTIIATNPDGNDYFMRGTYNGEPFEINHIGEFENNAPISTHFDRFGTEFTKTDKDGYYLTFITLALRREENSNLEDLIEVGNFEMHDGPLPTPPDDDLGRWFYSLNIGSRKINGIIHDVIYDTSFDKIEITSFERIPDPVGTNYSLGPFNGPLYKVTGNFQIRLRTINDDIVDLIIEEFSILLEDA